MNGATQLRVGAAIFSIAIFGLSLFLAFVVDSNDRASNGLVAGDSSQIESSVAPPSEEEDSVGQLLDEETPPIEADPNNAVQEKNGNEMAEIPEQSAGPADAEFAQLMRGLVAEPEQRSGYDRDLFRHWVDADGDGCDARREVLISESVESVQVGSGCSINGGYWVSVYDGRATRNPSDFDVDHFVPLAEAWDSGAHRWDASTRRAFANDLGYEMSLIAVSASSNRSKGADDPSTWMPPNSDFWCEYIYAWVNVKHRWDLSVDSREKESLELWWSDCRVGDLDFSPQAVKAVVVELGPAPAPEESQEPEPVPTPGTDPRYRTCRDAIASGYGDYIRGVDPEYSWYRDADSDGIVCER